MRRRIPTVQFLSALILALFLLLPDPAWATQTHGDPEGLIVHQMGHLFFLMSMAILIYWLRERGLSDIQGWKYIQYAAFFLGLWNIDAFLVHFVDEQTPILKITWIDPLHIVISAREGYRFFELVYYVAKLDHVLVVPALFLLYFGLQRLDREHEPPGGRGDGS